MVETLKMFNAGSPDALKWKWWDKYKKDALEFVKITFTGKGGEYIEGLWSVLVKIVENVGKVDFDHDGIKEHSREEILRAFKDEAIQFGDDLTEGIIMSAEGGFLKKLLASAQLATIVAKVIPQNFPLSEWLIGFLIERVVGMFKAGLVVADEKLDSWAEERQNEYKNALGSFILDLEKETKFNVQVEYFWGSDTFVLIAFKDNASEEEVVKVPGSVTALFEHKKNNYDNFLAVYIKKLQKALE